jgi:hypothetical protein
MPISFGKTRNKGMSQGYVTTYYYVVIFERRTLLLITQSSLFSTPCKFVIWRGVQKLEVHQLKWTCLTYNQESYFHHVKTRSIFTQSTSNFGHLLSYPSGSCDRTPRVQCHGDLIIWLGRTNDFDMASRAQPLKVAEHL